MTGASKTLLVIHQRHEVPERLLLGGRALGLLPAPASMDIFMDLGKSLGLED
jgi:hypothetical protein